MSAAFRLKKISGAVLLVVVFALLFAQRGGQALAPDESLPFTISYLVTGNYTVAGVDLLPGAAVNGFVTGTIRMSDVPDNADILAAFLLWETITVDVDPAVGAVGAKFRGQDITVDRARSKTSSELGASFAPCWTSGGGGSTYRLTMYRSDVLRLLPLQYDATGNPTGRRLVNDVDLPAAADKLTVTLPEAGTGNQDPQSAGGSLFVVWRNPNQNAPLTKVVLYDGLFVQTQGQAMTHKIRGFLDAADVNPVIKLTHVVGSGANNGNDQVFFNGVPLTQGKDRFARASGGTSDRGWSNPTFSNQPLTPGGAPNPEYSANFSLTGLQTDNTYGDSVTTKVDHGGNDSPNDCLSWAAIIFSTTVQDSDGDGLPDKLEDADNSEGGVSYSLKEPNDEKLPNIHDMGASSQHKDLFLEVGAHKAIAGLGYGPLSSVAHNHLPKPAVWKMVGDTLKNAPVSNPDSVPGIKLHVDVGPGYSQLGGDYESTIANEYLVTDAALARGGELIQEADCVEDTQTPPRWVCQFPDFAGTVSWKIGFQFIRDAPVSASGEETPDSACLAAGTCRRRFDRARKDIFHYGLYAHAVGIPKSAFPCLSGNPPVPTLALNPDGTCAAGQAINNDFHVPKGTSGLGDLPGADFMIGLGPWDTVNFVGTVFAQASTTLHEMGHNFERWHGGDPPQISKVNGTGPNTPVSVSVEPNCKPNYLSVMSYMFQVHGLIGIDGIPRMNYSSQVSDPINETNLGNGYSLPFGTIYRTSWYAPLAGSSAEALGVPAAKRYCGGGSFPFTGTPPTDWVDMVRIDGTTVGTISAWNPTGVGQQDVNFDGGLSGSTPLTGADDWSKLRLNQIGARRNMLGYSLGVAPDIWGVGPDIWGVGPDIWGVGPDIWGVGPDIWGVGPDIWGVGPDIWGVGPDIWGVGSDIWGLGPDIWGVGPDIWGIGNDIWGVHDQTFDDVAAGGYPSVGGLAATLIQGDVCDPTLTSFRPADCHRVRLDWTAPTAGNPLRYRISRVPGDEVIPGSLSLGVVQAVTGQDAYSFVDTQELPNGQFTYVVIAELPDGPDAGTAVDLSLPASDTILAVNAAPIANNDSYTTPSGVTLIVSTPGVLGVKPAPGWDVDIDSPTLTVMLVPGTGPSHGALTLNPNGSFQYAPSPGFVGLDSFKYKANDIDPTRSSNEATVTIDVKPPFTGVTGVQNLPPPSNKTFKPGSTVTLQWRYTLGGVAVNSSTADPEVRITGPAGLVININPQEPGHSVFKLPTASNGWTWQLNWQTDVTSTGAALPPGPYMVTIRSRLTGLTLGPVGPITLK